MIVYFDESGDLGWTFDKPYRHGGSSRYLTIPFLIATGESCTYPKRIIRKLYKKYRISPSTEKKGNDLTDGQRTFLVSETVEMLKKHQDVHISSITVRKENVMPHIRADANKLYNWMTCLTILDDISKEAAVTLIPDPRSIKVQSGNSMVDYLQIKLWFEKTVKTTLRLQPVDSKESLCLKFIDMVSNIIWAKYEDGRTTHADLLLPHIRHRELFFGGLGPP